MVRVLKCHSFSSQQVIPVNKEPLTICADHDKVFVAMSDCEIIVFHISDGVSTETQRCPTISQVEKIVYNSFKNYIATIELKKSWKRTTKSVRLYLNWETSLPGSAKPRTKVRVAGRPHVQHMSGALRTEQMEIVEVPLDENATGMSVCRYTGNFAVACGSEVKLCSVVEKTVTNSDKVYLDVEIFLELSWNFQIQAIALCEEFIVCCSEKEVQGIRVRYDEGEKKQHKRLPVSSSNSTGSRGLGFLNQELLGSSRHSSEEAIPGLYVSETLLFPETKMKRRTASISSQSETRDSEHKPFFKRNSDTLVSAKDFSVVGMWPARQSHQISDADSLEASIVDDENFVEWDFRVHGNAAGGASVCLPGLHADSSQFHCCLRGHVISPPVLSDFSRGKAKSVSGVQAETVLHLSDSQEKEEWLSIILIPTYSSGIPVQASNTSTDRMRSASSAVRTSMCCYVSGSRGGYLYQISPQLAQVSSYKYTDKALQVGVSQSYLHVVTSLGIETYTSRWGAVSLEMQKKEKDESDIEQIHPASDLDICLCGHEPFVGAVNLSVGTDFLALLSKVEDPSSNEAMWGLYVLQTFNLVDAYNDMIAFAEKIRITGPASYIHLLQEAHLLLSTNPLCTVVRDAEVNECLCQVRQLLGEYYAQPGQEDWTLCWPYFHSAGTSVQDIVKLALEKVEKSKAQDFGKGLLDCLDHILFSKEEYINLTSSTCDSILKIYATSSPENLSQVILLSNMKSFSAEKAFSHLKSWLSLKASASQPISAVDSLAMVQLQLMICEVEDACSQLNTINKSSLVDVCSSHPVLIHNDLSSFTPLAQLMRQHMSDTLLEILVEMLDRCVMSFDSLLILLRSQSDLPYSNHTREVLELILCDEKRAFLFAEAAQLLCQIYIAYLQEKPQPTPRQMNALTHQKCSLPQGNGHFAPRFAWLDYLPPFQGPNKMARPCQRLEVKHIPGHGSRSASLPITMVAKQTHKERCQCFVCNENLLKLQSLLCSPRLTSDLATFVIQQLGDSKDEDQNETTEADDDDDDECWDSVRLLCLTKLNTEKATEQIVDKYSSIAGMFAASCFSGDVDKYSHLLRCLETAMKSSHVLSPLLREETYAKVYKELLSRMAELFPPGQFLELLPADGNLYFFLPFLCTSMKLDHTDKLKQKIMDMGRELMSHN